MPPFFAFAPARATPRLLIAATLAALPLAGCVSVDRTVPTASVPNDFHQRHPVVLAEAPEVLDIFPIGAGGRLDTRDQRSLDAFASAYRASGQGSIVIRMPDRPADRAAADASLAAVRRALVADGVRGTIDIGTYPVADPRLASPLHLSFGRVQARLASRCGDWPDDLNSGANTNTWDNRTYYNLGCASAKTLSAQIDDPRDLLGPRAEDPSDVQLRTRAIGALRSGTDPGTNWFGASPTPISSVGN